MLFAPDTELALQAMAALVNSQWTDRGDELTTVAQLDQFLDTWGWGGRRDRTDHELAAVRALRPQLGEFWKADRQSAVDIVNRILRDRHALPQLVKHDHWDFHLHATSLEAPLADRMAVEAAMAMVDVLRMGELGRFSTCSAGDCSDVLIDLSKNRSRRFCSNSCANRTNVAAYRSRRAAASTG